MTLKDDRKLKDMNTMSAGKTTSKIEAGTKLTLHGHTVSVITTDASDTIVVYANNANRIFDTAALNGYLDLGTFPTGTQLTRPTADGLEDARIAAVTGNCCYQVEITDETDTTGSMTLTYAEFIEWHMSGATKTPEIPLPNGAQLYVPKPVVTAQPEAIEFGQARIDDLLEKLDKANKNAEQAEINGQIRINALQREVGEWKAALLTQHDQHVTELLAKNAEIERLETKASLLAPTCKEYLVKQNIFETDMNKLSREGWQIQHMQFMTDPDYSGQLWVVFVRDASTSPAPRVTVAETAAAIYGTSPAAVSQQPPLRVPTPAAPALNQVIVGLDAAQPVSRQLTNNGPRPGDTKRIPELRQAVQMQRQQDAAELAEIFERGTQAQEALRREFASRTSPFTPVGVQQS